MSLVNEALKKARLEAARQDAAQRGISFPATAGPQIPRRRPPWALLSLALGAALLGGLLYLAGRRSATPEGRAQIAATPATATPAPLQSAEPPAPAEIPKPAPVASAPETQPVPATPVREAAAEPASEPIKPARSGRPATRPATRTEAPAPPPPTRARAEEAPRQPERSPVRIVTSPSAAAEPATPPALPSFLREAEVPGSGRLILGGIAWSEDRPFALINGEVVGPGDRIQKLTVVRIERREVELQGEQGGLLLRLK